jgi:hypothetical protein
MPSLVKINDILLSCLITRMKRITWHLSVTQRILHIVFPKPDKPTLAEQHTYFLRVQKNPCKAYENYTLCNDVLSASARYEGPNQFVGFNFPVTSVRPSETVLWQIYQHYPTIQYVIAYLKSDKSSMEHELRHARFYIDKPYQARVKNAWKRLKKLHPDEYDRIVRRLTASGYQERVFVDEFQAYEPRWVDLLA